MTEAKLYESLRRTLKPCGFELTRIENTTVHGIPDIFFSFDRWSVVNEEERGCGWIELKILDGNGFRHGLTPNQIGWIVSNTKNDVPVFVVAYDEREESIWVWKGDCVVKLAEADRERRIRAFSPYLKVEKGVRRQTLADGIADGVLHGSFRR